jgi:hypothetical protein
MMRPSSLLAAVFTLAGCATSQPMRAPEVPGALQPAHGQNLHLEALATGVQVYECSVKSDATYAWVFKAPEATLTSRSGKPLGTHYAGPTWQSEDGSTVVAEVTGRDPGPNPSAIPWLLLAAKSNGGSGTFAATKSIQRVRTAGGVAPTEPCSGANLKQVARVPYTATYYFYR